MSPFRAAVAQHSGIKVLHVISGIDPRGGGPAEALRGLATAQATAGLNVRVLATFAPGDDLGFSAVLEARGVAVRLVGPCRGRLGRHPDLVAATGQAVAAADVVHVHTLWEEVQHQAARAARLSAKPYLIRPCGMLDPWSLRQSRLKKLLYLFWRLRRNLNAANALHFTSRAERDGTAQLGLRPPAIVEPNGIDVSEYANLPPPGTFRQRWGIPAGPTVLLFLGRLHPKKGLDLLLPAFARLGGDSLLVVAGPGEEGYRLRLKKETNRLGIADRVLFTDMLLGSDKLAAFADADLFVLPSYQENFGIAVAEAMAAGLPVVVSDQVNIHAEVTAAGAGGVVPTDAAALAAELARWLDDPARRRRAGASARAYAYDRYDWSAIAGRWEGHYERLVGDAGQRIG
jgi:glycosyltransferase involved in cell wall biosynthesis